LNRAARFDADIEFVDVISTAVANGDLTPSDRGLLFLHVDDERHPRLAKQKTSDENRRDVVGHLRKTVYSSYIKDLYEDFSAYLTEMVCVTRKSFTPDKIGGSHKITVDANDLLECGSWDRVVALVGESLFDRLGGFSNTKRIVQAMDDILGLDLGKAVVLNAQPYVELRHLLVHADGVASDAFCAEFPDFGAYPDQPVKLGQQTVHDARLAITDLVEQIDAKAIAAGFVAGEDTQ
jgi:hypothetical protein